MSSSGIRRPQPIVRQSIRLRLLALLLGLTTISVLTVGYLGVSSVQSVGESAQQVSAKALRAQAEEYLRQVTVGEAQRNDLILERVRHDAENVARYAASIFERSDAFTGGAYWQAEDHMFIGPDGQYMNGESDVSSAFVPDFVTIDEELLQVLELGAYLDFSFAPTYENDPNTVAIYLGTEQEATLYHPNVNLGALVPPDFRVTQRPWYVNATPENNPERGVVWSPVYVDATGKGLMVTAAAPVYTSQGDFVGVVGIDVTLKDISANIEAAHSTSSEQAQLPGSGYSFLIDDTGHAIALPEQGYQDILGRSPEPDELWTDLSRVTTEFAPVLVTKMMAGATGFDTLEAGGRELFVAYAPLENTGWSLAHVVDAETVLQAMGALQEDLETWTRSLVLARILPVGGGILAVVAVIGLLLTNRLTDPIQRLAIAAQRIGTGQWDTPLPRAGNDEIGVLSQAFATMTVQLRNLMESLEQRVTERTRDLERRSIQLEAAAQVAREAAAIHDVSQLLDATVRLISERFGFYHAGIFLLDEAREYAVLQAASSDGGQRMLAREHQLKVGKVGIVGFVAGTGEPRIALDVGKDAVFFDNPDLPLTRSEMALPLRVRDHLIGVLDVQSTEAAAFTDEDVAILRTMADQVALAIENAHLLEEAQDRLQEVDILLGRYSREGWAQLATERPRWGYVYNGVEVAPLRPPLGPPRQTRSRLPQPWQGGPQGRLGTGGTGEVKPQLTVPLRVRGEAIGHLDLVLADRPLTQNEEVFVQEVAEQASLALENARLFQETQRTLGETEALYRASQAIGAATSPAGVGQALTDYAATSGVDAVRILFFEHDAQGRPAYMVLCEGWTVDDRPVQPHGTRLSLEDYALAGLMDPHEPIVVEDVLTDPRANETTRTLIVTISGLRSFVMVPIAIGERWFGMIFAGRNEPSTFADALIRGYWTLAGQAAVALEGKQLLEETRRRAEREQLLGEITARMRETLDVETVLKTAVREISEALGLAALDVRLATQPTGQTVDGTEQT